MCSYSTSLLFIQSIIVALCLPRVLVPSILPSKTLCRRDSLLNTWPNQFFCLSDGVHQASVLSTMSKTSWLDQCSVQLIFSKFTFQTIPVVECPLSSTSTFLRHTIPYSKSWCYIHINFLVSWAWCDWPLTLLTNHRPSVLWHCWLGQFIYI